MSPTDGCDGTCPDAERCVCGDSRRSVCREDCRVASGLGFNGCVGTLWVQEMGCGVGWGRAGRKECPTQRGQNEQARVVAGVFRELQIVLCGRSVWLVGREQQESGKGLASFGRVLGLFLKPVRSL